MRNVNWMPPVAAKPQQITKLEFCTQYVLARAATRPNSLSGQACAEAALEAWETIQKGCRDV